MPVTKNQNAVGQIIKRNISALRPTGISTKPKTMKDRLKNNDPAQKQTKVKNIGIISKPGAIAIQIKAISKKSINKWSVSYDFLSEKYQLGLAETLQPVKLGSVNTSVRVLALYK